MTSQPVIHFYYRNGCHLCEEMAAALHAGWPRVMEQMQWIDVDTSPALQQRYGSRVPVLVVDGRVLCQYLLDREAVSACFGAAPSPL